MSVFFDEPVEKYHSQSGVNLSSHLLISAHRDLDEWRKRMVEPRADTPAFAFGRAAHTHCIEGMEAFEAEYIVGGPQNTKTGKEYGSGSKAFQEWASMQKNEAITTGQFGQISRMSKSVHANKAAAKLLGIGKAEQVARVVEVASENADLVILDTPGTFNDLVATALVAADSVLAISSLGMASVRHTAEMLELLEIEGHPRDRLRLVLNQITPATPMLPQDVAAIVNHPVFWTIPYSAQVPESTANGRPIVLSNPKTDTAKQLRGLAEQLTGVAVPQRDLRALLRPGHLLRRSA